MIDSHAHLTSEKYHDDIDDVLERASECGISAIICVGFDLQSSRQSIELAERYPMVFAAVGIHPHDAASLNEKTIGDLEDLCNSNKVVAVGETGLDFYRNLSPRDSQEKAFIEQIALAKRKDLPLIVHSREAHSRVIEILRVERVSKGVMHCFSGGAEIAKEAIDLGLYISFAGPVTYGGSRFSNLLELIPKDRLLIETDCPYLSPVPHRGKRNEPSHLRFIAARLAELMNRSYKDIDNITTQNARLLFGIG
ncbi:MAG: TatD family hydrolase [bacterium]